MRFELISDSGPAPALVLAPPARPRMVLLMLVVGVLMSVALCAAAIIAHAPAPAVPMIALVCVGCPVFAGWEAPRALAAVRNNRAARGALADLRQGLDLLPETQHPLGL